MFVSDCCLKKRRHLKNNNLYKKGVRRIEHEIDITLIIKKLRALDTIAYTLFSKVQRQLLPFQRSNYLNDNFQEKRNIKKYEKFDDLKKEEQDKIKAAIGKFSLEGTDSVINRKFIKQLINIKKENKEDNKSEWSSPKKNSFATYHETSTFALRRMSKRVVPITVTTLDNEIFPQKKQHTLNERRNGKGDRFYTFEKKIDDLEDIQEQKDIDEWIFDQC